MLKKIINTDGAASTTLIRLMVGAVFLSEGLQKFLFTDKLGVGRFAKIGLPNPEFLAPLTGAFEIIAGALVITGLLTRLAAIPLLVIIMVAIAATKNQLLASNGFWAMLHDSRTDWAMLLGCIFLIIKGGGKWSLYRSLRKQ